MCLLLSVEMRLKIEEQNHCYPPGLTKPGFHTNQILQLLKIHNSKHKYAKFKILPAIL